VRRGVLVDRELDPLDALAVAAFADERDGLVGPHHVLLERDPAVVVVAEGLLVLTQALEPDLVADAGHGADVIRSDRPVRGAVSPGPLAVCANCSDLIKKIAKSEAVQKGRWSTEGTALK
jgi:hypothetical protein